jgi:2-phospho-L-lactate/phosphoenolpyruvate guanylyltransferase
MTYRAVIPVKALSEAKSRLAPYLSQAQRSTLVLDMLQHVIHAIQASACFNTITVVSSDAQVMELARQWGAHARKEEEQGHNPALYAAALKEIADGATALLTISADLPLLRPEDIQHMVKLSHFYDVVLAASSEGTGTNALLTHPPLAVPYVFGIGSLQLYEEEARKRLLSSTRYKSCSTAIDIDTIDDLETMQCQKGVSSQQFAPSILFP